eukprot:PhM_4_TR15704/c0_g1_i1/m.84942
MADVITVDCVDSLDADDIMHCALRMLVWCSDSTNNNNHNDSSSSSPAVTTTNNNNNEIETDKLFCLAFPLAHAILSDARHRQNSSSTERDLRTSPWFWLTPEWHTAFEEEPPSPSPTSQQDNNNNNSTRQLRLRYACFARSVHMTPQQRSEAVAHLSLPTPPADSFLHDPEWLQHQPSSFPAPLIFNLYCALLSPVFAPVPPSSASSSSSSSRRHASIRRLRMWEQRISDFITRTALFRQTYGVTDFMHACAFLHVMFCGYLAGKVCAEDLMSLVLVDRAYYPGLTQLAATRLTVPSEVECRCLVLTHLRAETSRRIIELTTTTMTDPALLADVNCSTLNTSCLPAQATAAHNHSEVLTYLTQVLLAAYPSAADVLAQQQQRPQSGASQSGNARPQSAASQQQQRPQSAGRYRTEVTDVEEVMESTSPHHPHQLPLVNSRNTLSDPRIGATLHEVVVTCTGSTSSSTHHGSSGGLSLPQAFQSLASSEAIVDLGGVIRTVISALVTRVKAQVRNGGFGEEEDPVARGGGLGSRRGSLSSGATDSRTFLRILWSVAELQPWEEEALDNNFNRVVPVAMLPTLLSSVLKEIHVLSVHVLRGVTAGFPGGAALGLHETLQRLAVELQRSCETLLAFERAPVDGPPPAPLPPPLPHMSDTTTHVPDTSTAATPDASPIRCDSPTHKSDGKARRVPKGVVNASVVELALSCPLLPSHDSATVATTSATLIQTAVLVLVLERSVREHILGVAMTTPRVTTPTMVSEEDVEEVRARGIERGDKKSVVEALNKMHLSTRSDSLSSITSPTCSLYNYTAESPSAMAGDVPPGVSALLGMCERTTGEMLDAVLERWHGTTEMCLLDTFRRIVAVDNWTPVHPSEAVTSSAVDTALYVNRLCGTVGTGLSEAWATYLTIADMTTLRRQSRHAPPTAQDLHKGFQMCCSRLLERIRGDCRALCNDVLVRFSESMTASLEGVRSATATASSPHELAAVMTTSAAVRAVSKADVWHRINNIQFLSQRLEDTLRIVEAKINAFASDHPPVAPTTTVSNAMDADAAMSTIGSISPRQTPSGATSPSATGGGGGFLNSSAAQLLQQQLNEETPPPDWVTPATATIVQHSIDLLCGVLARQTVYLDDMMAAAVLENTYKGTFAPLTESHGQIRAALLDTLLHVAEDVRPTLARCVLREISALCTYRLVRGKMRVPATIDRFTLYCQLCVDLLTLGEMFYQDFGVPVRDCEAATTDFFAAVQLYLIPDADDVIFGHIRQVKFYESIQLPRHTLMRLLSIVAPTTHTSGVSKSPSSPPDRYGRGVAVSILRRSLTRLDDDGQHVMMCKGVGATTNTTGTGTAKVAADALGHHSAAAAVDTVALADVDKQTSKTCVIS